MSNQPASDIQGNLTSYVTEHPNASYEEWIGAFCPEKTRDSLLGDGFGMIDSSFYEPESEHLQAWNESVKGTTTRTAVAAVSSSSSSENASSTSFGGSGGGIMDLLSNEPGSPVQQSQPAFQHSPVEPGQDLLSFD